MESGNCSWNKCVFCGYSRSAARRPHAARLKVGLDRQLLDFQGGTLKIFASGSFLDDAQFAREFRQYLAQKCRAKGVDKLIFESRPEFITEESLKDFEGISLSVAIGLEVADDEALSRICKGFKVEDFVRAAKLLHTHGFGVRAYLLVNPPFAGDIEKSLKKSVELALPLSDSIVLINLLPHGSAPLFKIWLRGEWKPLSRKRFFEITGPYANSPKIELDAETFRFVPRFPDSMRESLVGVSSGMLNHPHFNAWQQYICD